MGMAVGVIRMIVIVGQGFPSKIRETLVNGIMVVLIRVPFHHGDGVQGTRAQAGAQAVAIYIADKLRLAIDYLESALGAIRYAQSAPVTLVFVYMNHRSDCHFVPPCVQKSKIRNLKSVPAYNSFSMVAI
jgi:hypothetical protein